MGDYWSVRICINRFYDVYMANRVNLNRLLRSVHFFSSILIFAFVLLYIFTGLVMSKHEWFPHGEEAKVIQVKPLNYLPDTSKLENFGNEIKEQFGISGRMEYRRTSKNGIIYTFYRPGVRNVVNVHSALDSLTITRTEKLTFGEVSTRIHRLHGFKGGTLYLVWGVLVDLAAFSMIVFAVTGFWIWYRSRKVHQYGWLFIVPFVILATVMFIFLS